MNKAYVSTIEYGKSLNPPISARRVRKLCEKGRINAEKISGVWFVKSDSPDPRQLEYRRNL